MTDPTAKEISLRLGQRLPASVVVSGTGTLPQAARLDHTHEPSPWAQAAGTLNTSGTAIASGGIYTATITFPTARFTQAPFVFTVFNAAPGGSGFMVARATNVTTANFLLVLYNTGTLPATWVNGTVVWHALQMTSTSSAG